MNVIALVISNTAINTQNEYVFQTAGEIQQPSEA
jgi:hypothetical protein